MPKRAFLMLTVAASFVAIFMFGNNLVPTAGQEKSAATAMTKEKGGQDIFGDYDVVKDWPKPISALPGNEKWTWGAASAVFAESPDRVYIFQRGELPNMKAPKEVDMSQAGPSLTFPIGRLPWRDATIASPPGPIDGPNRGTENVDYRWENCLVVVDAAGNIIEQWKQWDSMWRRPHAVYINPYDPEKHVWIVDDYLQAIFKFTHDGKQIVQTIGEVKVHGNDDKHFNRPTYLAWLPDGTLFVADGYVNTRIVKFDKDGKYLTSWGQAGTPPNDQRPGYMNAVHGLAVDAESRRVYVSDRSNHRIQVFDENGKFLNQWRVGDPPSDVHLIYMAANHHLWAADRGTNKMVEYDAEGNFVYSWGTWGDFPGGMWGVHGMSVDQEGNLYVSEVDNGRVQKYTPKKGANPLHLVGPPVKPVWK